MPKKYNPQQTRETILDAAYDEFWKNGYRVANVDNIIKHTGVTKGALYYHFKNKDELGYAVIEERLHEEFLEKWIRPLETVSDPIEDILEVCRVNLIEEMTDDIVQHGCPLNNMIQEMSPQQEAFRTRLNLIYEMWFEALERVLRQGQDTGTVNTDVDVAAVARFIVAVIHGVTGETKNNRMAEMYTYSYQALALFMRQLCA